jgi:hypothetical protein
VDLGVDAEVEADRLEDDERGAGRVDVGGGQDAGVLLDDRAFRPNSDEAPRWSAWWCE